MPRLDPSSGGPRKCHSYVHARSTSAHLATLFVAIISFKTRYQKLDEMHSSRVADHHAIAIDLHNLGTEFHKLGDHDTATGMYKESLQAMLELLPVEDSSHNIICTKNKKDVERRLAKVSMAERKLATLESHVGPEDYASDPHCTSLISEPLEIPCVGKQERSLKASSSFVMYNMALAQYKLGSMESSMQLFESALEVDPEESCFLRPAIWNNLGHIAFCGNRPKDAINNFSEAWKLGQRTLRAVRHTSITTSPECCENGETKLKAVMDQHVAIIVTNVAFTTNYFGEVSQQLGHYDEARNILEIAFKTLKRFNLLPDSYSKELPPIYSIILYNYGAICFLRGDSRRGRLAFDTFFRLQRCTLVEKGHQDVASLLYNIGMAQLQQGHTERAIMSFHESRVLKRQLNGNDHEDVAKCLYNIGRSYLRNGEDSKAMEFFQETLRIEKACMGQQHLDVALTVNCIGDVYHRCGNLDKALEAYHEALRITKQASGDCQLVQLKLMNAIGNVHIEQGNMCEAIGVFFETEALLSALLRAPFSVGQELDGFVRLQEMLKQVIERPPGAGAA